MKKRLAAILALSLSATTPWARACGCYVDDSDRDYATVGMNITRHFGSKGFTSFGPEFSFGHLYTIPVIASASLSIESINWFQGLRMTSRIHGGTFLFGGSTGVDFIRMGQANRFGLGFDLWAGFGAYIMGTYSIMQDYGGLSLSGKLKVPVYEEKTGFPIKMTTR